RSRRRQTRAAAVDGRAAPRHRDAAAGDVAHSGDTAGWAAWVFPGLSPGLSPGVSRTGARVRDGPVRRADGEPRRGERMSRVPAMQRATGTCRELFATPALAASPARVRAARVARLVGMAHASRGRRGGAGARALA